MPDLNTSSVSVGILGGGISGLTVAYALQKKGFMVTVYEKADKVGGAIKTLNKAGWQVEIWFRIMSKDATCHLQKQLVDPLSEYITTYKPERTIPFKWSYDRK